VRHTPSTVGYAPPSVVQPTPSAVHEMAGVHLSSVVRAGGVLPPTAPALLEPLESPGWVARVWRDQPWVVAGAFMVVFVATTVAVALHHPPTREAQPELLPPPPVPAAQVALPKPSAPEMIVFSVSVTPSSAQIAIDGQPMPSNPFVGHFPKATGTHRIRASAPGHQPKERRVSFDDNVMIDLSLQPQPQPAPPPAHASTERAPSRRWEPPRHDVAPAHPVQPIATRPATATASPSLAPAPAAAPARQDITPRSEWEAPRKRTIDTSNPYGEEK
jgi:hypothetical protein